MPPLAARMQFLYAMNIALPGALAALHLFNPTLASTQLWQGAKAVLPLQMLGAWWTAVALLSAMGLRNPYKYRWVLPHAWACRCCLRACTAGDPNHKCRC